MIISLIILNKIQLHLKNVQKPRVCDKMATLLQEILTTTMNFGKYKYTKEYPNIRQKKRLTLTHLYGHQTC